MINNTVMELRPFNVAGRSRKTDGVMNNVELFFSKPENMGKLLPLMHGESKISLRMVEWFTFVHSMEHTVDWFIDNKYFNVYMDYQKEMKEHTKQRFDPMGRKWRKEKHRVGDKEVVQKVYHGINFYYNEKDYVVTCVAQLNFFRWFIGNGVLDYMLEHYNELAMEMNKYNITTKQNKRLTDTDVESNASTNKKIRVQAMKKVTKKHVEVYVSFD